MICTRKVIFHSELVQANDGDWINLKPLNRFLDQYPNPKFYLKYADWFKTLWYQDKLIR